MGVCFAVSLGTIADYAIAGEKRDHEAARRAYQEGKVRSLSDILAELRSQLGGEVIEVELEAKGKIYLYEFKVLTPAGRVKEFTVDAATGKVVKSE
jgi:uncharacterized membrane protein YkoI